MKTIQPFDFLPPLLQRKPFVDDSNVDYSCTRFANFKILIMPGLHGSDHDHWQSAWELWYPEFQRVEQVDWENAELDNWARRLVECATGSSRPVIVVAHSFGCLATVRASILQSGLIAGALLVAPVDPARFDVESHLPGSILGIPTMMVASTNDPYMELGSAGKWASRWDSQMVTLQDAGHINVKSGYRSWPRGLELLESVCQRALNVGAANSRLSKFPEQSFIFG